MENDANARKAGGPPALPVWRSRGYLPHYDSDKVFQFITYRLADSLPKSVIEALRRRHDGDEASFHKAVEAGLDGCHGCCVLRRPEVARLVIENWRHFHGVRYGLIGWVVMPNHVHLLIYPFPGHGLAEIVHGWKSYTAKRVLEMRGVDFADHRVWQEEYRDRFIRDERHYHAALAYIVNNPVKAKLAERPEQWPWSHVSGREGAAS